MTIPEERIRRAVSPRWPLVVLMCLIILLGLVGCGKPREQGENGFRARPPGTAGPASEKGQQLVIFHAASLARPFGDLEELFEQQHPGVDVVRESGASVSEARKITELGRRCDVYAAADYTVVDDLLIPHFADYNLLFLRERIGLGYTQRARYASEIDSDNWYRILLRPEVKVGYANPAVAPLGWRTLLVWKLADLYYHQGGSKSIYEQLKAKIPGRYIVPDAAALEPLLESLEIDYAFVYQATAMQHNLQWVKLPDQIDLGNEQHADFYARAEVTVPDKTGRATKYRGTPCLYGLTILKEAPHPELALQWLKFLFSEPGQQALQRHFLEPVNPPLCREKDVLPKELQSNVKEAAF